MCVESIRYLEPHYLELSICPTIFLVSSALLSLFSILYLKHTFEINTFKHTYKEYIRKFWSNVYLFLFLHSNMLVKQKLTVKSLGEKIQALKHLESDLSNKEVSVEY